MTDRLCGLVGRARCLVLLVLLIATGTCTAYADNWTALQIPASDGTPPDMTFVLGDTGLSLNASHVVSWGGSSSDTYDLLFSGQWAVTGQIVGGTLMPDSYATFAVTGPGSGYIEWASNTPTGYVAPLVLGGVFGGDSAATYRDFFLGDYGETVTGTLVVVNYPTKMPQDAQDYWRVSHTFYVTSPVPEPPSLLAFVCGLVGLGRMARRSRKD